MVFVLRYLLPLDNQWILSLAPDLSLKAFIFYDKNSKELLPLLSSENGFYCKSFLSFTGWTSSFYTDRLCSIYYSSVGHFGFIHSSSDRNQKLHLNNCQIMKRCKTLLIWSHAYRVWTQLQLVSFLYIGAHSIYNTILYKGTPSSFINYSGFQNLWEWEKLAVLLIFFYSYLICNICFFICSIPQILPQDLVLYVSGIILSLCNLRRRFK